MNSRIFVGELMHARLEPVRHTFHYPVYMYALDVDELPELERHSRLFGYNRFRPISIYDKDYLGNGGGTLRSKVEKFLSMKGIQDPIDRIDLVTSARYFNYVFNPVSFFYCYLGDGSLRAVLAEVNNTFKETHLYILDEPQPVHNGTYARFKTKKEFHVSPFFDVSGEYDFKLSDIREKLDIWINLIKQDRTALMSQLTGNPMPLTTKNIIKTVICFPLSAVLTVPRIMWQAVKLHYLKKLRVFEKPNPSSPMTLRTVPATPVQKICMSLVFKYLSRIEKGCLQMNLPDGQMFRFGSGPAIAMNIRNYGFFTRIIRDGDIGFGESYMEGEWDSPDLVALLELFIDNAEKLNRHHVVFAVIGRLLNRLMHLARRNTLSNSRKNIEGHYDLGNDFFRLFLDESMMYSSAYFKDSFESLAEAQRNKLDMIIEKSRIGIRDHVLEIGSGWGGFAIRAAQKTGCRVTTITLSKEQYAYVSQNVEALGLEGQIEVKLCDYRHVEGTFDKIVSIEMLEAVGHEYYGTFFKACERLLAPDGIIVIQTITIPDQRYEDYRKRTDWIQKHIFPGGHLPSLAVLSQTLARETRFIIEDLENIGIHYARTLRKWREKFDFNWENIQNLGFDEKFKRKWDYYFSYCEAGFNARYIADLQLVLTRPNNRKLSI